jgi:hypothetical protein
LFPPSWTQNCSISTVIIQTWGYRALSCSVPR